MGINYFKIKIISFTWIGDETMSFVMTKSKPKKGGFSIRLACLFLDEDLSGIIWGLSILSKLKVSLTLQQHQLHYCQ